MWRFLRVVAASTCRNKVVDCNSLDGASPAGKFECLSDALDTMELRQLSAVSEFLQLTSDDVIADLSGTHGHVGMGFYLASPVGKVVVVGTSRSADELVSKGGSVAQPLAAQATAEGKQFVTGDEGSILQDASVLIAGSTEEQLVHAAMLASSSPPGTMLVSSKRIPGCVAGFWLDIRTDPNATLFTYLRAPKPSSAPTEPPLSKEFVEASRQLTQTYFGQMTGDDVFLHPDNATSAVPHPGRRARIFRHIGIPDAAVMTVDELDPFLFSNFQGSQMSVLDCILEDVFVEASLSLGTPTSLSSAVTHGGRDPGRVVHAAPRRGLSDPSEFLHLLDVAVGDIHEQDHVVEVDAGVGERAIATHLASGAGTVVAISTDAVNASMAKAAAARLAGTGGFATVGQAIVDLARPAGRLEIMQMTDGWTEEDVVVNGTIFSLLHSPDAVAHAQSLLAANLQPGTLLLLPDALPGCHLGVFRLRLVKHRKQQIHVYMVAVPLAEQHTIGDIFSNIPDVKTPTHVDTIAARIEKVYDSISVDGSVDESSFRQVADSCDVCVTRMLSEFGDSAPPALEQTLTKEAFVKLVKPSVIGGQTDPWVCAFMQFGGLPESAQSPSSVLAMLSWFKWQDKDVLYHIGASSLVLGAIAHGSSPVTNVQVFASNASNLQAAKSSLSQFKKSSLFRPARKLEVHGPAPSVQSLRDARLVFFEDVDAGFVKRALQHLEQYYSAIPSCQRGKHWILSAQQLPPELLSHLVYIRDFGFHTVGAARSFKPVFLYAVGNPEDDMIVLD
mmetsp:Transcript_5707/g.13881  ORF Transcript_5707/g.13881 Transcript_5707/m.13881 type:complete len:785 (-) Transcript_5707:64-2418(-)